ncbi:hypothetical protein BELL_0292g00030 [Botrytis elliptica]|uniref:Uncharacterized protein n=1 Tax=Botrytis elliptica TaxID=278938 RepID=A0A4Z1JZD7_9HELO|nr:hypothetical protein EAE99_012369 [Botrytis elliptica]TGO74307.1 hypothetical protein BELL_0292g00030 [Botrytis elliptica]
MADTAMQDTAMQDIVMQDPDMQDTVMQDTTTQDTTTQDITTQDTTTQDTIEPGVVRKIAKMRTPGKTGSEISIYHNKWKTSEKVHLLHLYTIHPDISRLENGDFRYRAGALASLTRDMTAESVKHYPGGSLHETDPWVPRTYTDEMIRRAVVRYLLEEDNLALELEAELNAHYGLVSDVAVEEAALKRAAAERRALVKESRMAKRLARELRQREKAILREEKEKKFQEDRRKREQERIKNVNEALRLAFAKPKKPVIIAKTDA